VADEEFTVEPFSFITKDFPVVVVKENATLSDDERAQFFERLDVLLDAGKAHALILDLTNAGEVPEAQRVFISESLQLREEQLESAWLSMAIIVSSQGAGANSEIAVFWQKAVPVPSQVFTNSMSATVWSRQVVEKHVRALREMNDPEGEGPRPSDPIVRRPDARAPAERPARATRPNKVRPKSRPAVSIFRSPAFWVAIAALLSCVGFLSLSSSERGLSVSEQEAFQKSKDKFAVRLLKKAGRRRVPIERGQPIERGATLVYQIDLPSRAYMLVFGVRSDRKLYVAWSEDGTKSVGPLPAGKSLPRASVDLSTGEEREWLHFVACGEPIVTKDCKAQDDGQTLTCPQTCTVSSFPIDKVRAGT
jgi:hypothetical protein